MTSSRSIYRQKRIDLIKDSISLLCDMLLMTHEQREQIPLSNFKLLNKLLLRQDKKTIIFRQGF